MKSSIYRVWVALLSLVMLAGLGSALGPGSVQAQEPPGTSQAAAPAGAIEEIVEMRARHRKVFRYNETPRLVDGQAVERRTMQVSLASLHYPDAAGQWQDVDLRPVDAGSAYRVDKTNAPVGLPRLGSEALVIQAGKETISVRLVGASGAQASLATAPGATQATQVAFADLLPQTDIAYQAEPDGLREFITLKGPGHPTVFTFEVATALKMSLADGAVVFTNAAGEAVGQFTRPWVTAPGAPPVTRWGTLSLDGTRLTMTLPDLSGLAYPIVVDPTYNVSLTGSANDGYAVPAWSSWNATDVRVNLGKGLSGETYNTALRWDTATTIPQGTNITSAYVKFVADNSQGNSVTYVNIKGAGSNDNDVIDNYTEWNSIPRTSASVGWTIPAWTAMTVYTSPDIASVIQEAVNHSGFNGAFLLFFDDNGSTAGATRSAYSYDGSSTYAPQLEVNYDVKASVLKLYFSDIANATAVYVLSGTDISSIQVDAADNRGSGFGSFSTAFVTALGGSTLATNCTGYYTEARWRADYSTASTNIKWRVRVPASKTAKDDASPSCTTHTTTESHAFWAYRSDPIPSGSHDFVMGLGIWP